MIEAMTKSSEKAADPAKICFVRVFGATFRIDRTTFRQHNTTVECDSELSNELNECWLDELLRDCDFSSPTTVAVATSPFVSVLMSSTSLSSSCLVSLRRGYAVVNDHRRSPLSLEESVVIEETPTPAFEAM